MPDNKNQSAYDYIKKQTYKIQRSLAKTITFKFTPKIHFKLDYTEKHASHIDNLLDNLD